ncbi:hypothetical protein EDB87DRAFT_1169437 [Lactarius vividus]|nr:hypothetical protein EDB87DRAFT_1169437 [Lactarius vividus]
MFYFFSALYSFLLKVISHSGVRCERRRDTNEPVIFGSFVFLTTSTALFTALKIENDRYSKREVTVLPGGARFQRRSRCALVVQLMVHLSPCQILSSGSDPANTDYGASRFGPLSHCFLPAFGIAIGGHFRQLSTATLILNTGEVGDLLFVLRYIRGPENVLASVFLESCVRFGKDYVFHSLGTHGGQVSVYWL